MVNPIFFMHSPSPQNSDMSRLRR